MSLLGIRAGLVHPVEPWPWLPGNASGDHWGGGEHWKLCCGWVLESSRRAGQLPAYASNTKIYTGKNNLSCNQMQTRSVLVSQQRLVPQMRTSFLRAQLQRLIASSVWWMISCFLMTISGAEFLVVLSWDPKRYEHSIKKIEKCIH